MGNNKNNKVYTTNKTANNKTLQEWRSVIIKLHNGMVNAHRQRKWARRDKLSKEHTEVTAKAIAQHGEEAVRRLLGTGVTLHTITKEEYEEAQKQNNTTDITFIQSIP